MLYLRLLALLTVMLFGLLLVPDALRAQDDQGLAQEEKKPEVIKREQQVPNEVVGAGKVPVMMEYEDMDSLGRRLVFNMRERFNKSDLFRLSGYKEQKLKIIFTSQEEFPSRPGLGSIYSIVWTFSYGQDVLDNFLEVEVGQISNQDLTDLAETLVARTDEIYNSYSYLFEE